MEIALATKEDAGEIQDLNQKFFHESERDFTKIIASVDMKLLIAKEDNRTVGFAGIEKSSWNKTAKGIDIFVHPDFRRRGIGLALAKAMIDEAKKMGIRSLIVEAPSQSDALPLYQKAGFRKCGYNDRYYANHSQEIAIYLSYDFEEIK